MRCVKGERARQLWRSRSLAKPEERGEKGTDGPSHRARRASPRARATERATHYSGFILGDRRGKERALFCFASVFSLSLSLRFCVRRTAAGETRRERREGGERAMCVCRRCVWDVAFVFRDQEEAPASAICCFARGRRTRGDDGGESAKELRCCCLTEGQPNPHAAYINLINPIFE